MHLHNNRITPLAQPAQQFGAVDGSVQFTASTVRARPDGDWDKRFQNAYNINYYNEIRKVYRV